MHRLDDILLNNEKLGEKQKALKHPLMHKVDALSYALVLEGQVTLIADENQTTLKAGDVIIDCGSHHAWSNRTDSVCRMMFVLIDAVRK
jgi:quercetin dioxygenase-like cupin family protein